MNKFVHNISHVKKSIQILVSLFLSIHIFSLLLKNQEICIVKQQIVYIVVFSI